MTVVNKPKIVACKGKSYVSVSWTPDFGRFGLAEIDSDLVGVFRRQGERSGDDGQGRMSRCTGSMGRRRR